MSKKETPIEKPETMTIKFYPAGMVTSYVVKDASGKRLTLTKGDIVELKEDDYRRLRASFPESFIPYIPPPDQKGIEGLSSKAHGGPEANKMHGGPAENK